MIIRPLGGLAEPAPAGPEHPACGGAAANAGAVHFRVNSFNSVFYGNFTFLPGSFLEVADRNGDERLNDFDTAPFIHLLAGG
jgi:hypothetical protein